LLRDCCRRTRCQPCSATPACWADPAARRLPPGCAAVRAADIATYGQWCAALDAGKPPARITWVCGPEVILRDEVADAVPARLAGSEVVRIRGSEITAAELGVLLTTYPPAPRVAIVRDADAVTAWDWLPDADEVCRTGQLLVLVSAERDFAPKAVQGKPQQDYPGVAAVRGVKGQLVRCALPVSVSAQVAWVQRRVPGISEAVAWMVLERSAHQLLAAASTCAKLRLSRSALRWEKPDELELMLENQVSDAVADLIVLGFREAAMRAVASLDHAQVGSLIETLSWTLETLVSVRTAVSRGMSADVARRELKVEPYKLAKFRAVAPHYDDRRIRRSRLLLAELDGAHRSGAAVCLPEALVALW
jgi:hypothetical protein